MSLHGTGPGTTVEYSLERLTPGRSGPYLSGAPAPRVTGGGISFASARLELALAVSGLGLSVFMLGHTGLLATVLLGDDVFDTLAEFIERYYLLHAFVPFLVVLFLGHIFLAARKVPVAYSEQAALVRHARSLGHFDTWAWAFQIFTGIALAMLIAIHLWVILTDLPIEAARSGSKITGKYLFFDAPFAVLVYTHMSAGLYRISVKWGIFGSAWAHRILGVWTVAILSLSAVIILAFYRTGGG